MSGRDRGCGRTGEAGLERAVGSAERFLDNIEIAVRGKREEIRLVLAALICRGHVLLEDVPGTAKTVLARAIAQTIEGASPSRIQCTPDLQPTDVTGLSIYDQRERDFEFRPGRSSPTSCSSTRSTGRCRRRSRRCSRRWPRRRSPSTASRATLPDPFLVLATQNPIELEGTFPLPEAQLDRFLLKTALGYPGADDELEIIRDQRHGHPLGGWSRRSRWPR